MNDRGRSIIIATAVSLAMSSISMCLRCFVRLRVVRAFGRDDATMVVAMVFNIAFAGVTLAGAQYGFGQHLMWFMDKPPSYLRNALLYWWLGQSFYLITAVVAKVSIAMTLLRITVIRPHTIILYLVSGLTILVGGMFVLVSVFECTPVDFFWNRQTKTGKCVQPIALVGIAYAASVIAAIADFTLGLMPIFIVWNLQMNRKTKVALAGIMGMGCLAGAAVIARIPYLSAYKHQDFLHATHAVSICSNIETGLGITASSLATLRPIFRFLRDSTVGSSKKPTSNSYPLSSVANNNDRHWADDNDDLHGMSTTITGRRPSLNPSTESVTPLYPGMKVERSFQIELT